MRPGRPRLTRRIPSIHRLNRRLRRGQVSRTPPKFGLNGFLITPAPKAAARKTIRQIAAQADREGNDGFAHSQAEFVTAHA
ncbi:hypothetical protein [Streptomyces acidicola]|uniref:Uncharacterized protein n=1 Tax=Streptomyces acidicola TaxID=2596892 RepID=A0A5N8WMN1_9ACTN|nr:hypothetical protein [Streptomyces acidicola]MPY48507.1 hypothetical protein [Streptomyces acidicola]